MVSSTALSQLQASPRQTSPSHAGPCLSAGRQPRRVACHSYQNRGPSNGPGGPGFGMGTNPWAFANDMANKTLAQLFQELQQEIARAQAQARAAGAASYPGTPGYTPPTPGYSPPNPSQTPPSYSSPSSQAPPSSSEVQLSVDIVETDDSFNLYADVPGLSKADLKIRINPKDRVLSISGERAQPSVATPSDSTDSSATRDRWERRFGSFKREVPLPETADTQAISAKVDRGVLRIKVLKHIKAPSSDQEIRID